ncbi:ABC transporter ATP-binding protein [Robertmurraya massiliosenegalensis]|uniref:ABC transporter ATP-binding protein n=1 Tax=Robertmurraya TaxID=2837507 RepID=UPI0039A57ADC
MTSQAFIELNNVYKVFTTIRKKKVDGFTALKDVSLSIKKGEFVSLVGPSGCGKSTILNLVAGLSFPSAGEVFKEGKQVNRLNVGIGYVTQDDNLFPWRNVLENVTYGLEIAGVARKERTERAQVLIEKVGLKGFENHYPHQLSGGMRKRAAIIRTLVCDPDIILMDEPFGPLDAQTRTVLQNDLLELWEGTGKTILFVTHDLVESIALSDRVVVFSSSPGTIKSIYSISLPRPRDVFHIHEAPGFTDLHNKLWTDIRHELQSTAL